MYNIHRFVKDPRNKRNKADKIIRWLLIQYKLDAGDKFTSESLLV